MRRNTTTEQPLDGSEWTVYLTPFASAIGKTLDETTAALTPLVGEVGPRAIELLQSDEFTPFEELRAALGETPLAVLRKAVSDHLRVSAAAPVEDAAPTQLVTAATSFDVLPSVPDDESLLRMLKAGGELKVNQGTVISAIRAALANRTGLYDLPELLVTKMEEFSESLEEPVGGEFFKLRTLLTKRSYSEIFAALEVEGSFISQRRKTAFLSRLDDVMWPALGSFQNALKGWTEGWQAGFNNPGALAAMMLSSGGGRVLPPGMMAPPPTDGLRDAAEDVIVNINRVFAGTGVPVAMALAYDAMKVKEVLENPTLPSQVGAANRDQMLKMFGAAVSSDYVRLEQNLTRYTLAIMGYPTVTADAELGYLTSLLMLGAQIPWERLNTPPRRTGGSRRVSDEA